MDCPECFRLLRELDAIVQRNIKVLEGFSQVVLNRRDEEIEQMRAELQDLEVRRREARIKLMGHQSKHPKIPATHN